MTHENIVVLALFLLVLFLFGNVIYLQRRCALLLRAINEVVEAVDAAPISTGVCCCGESMQHHSRAYDAGHTPIDEWDDYWPKVKRQLVKIKVLEDK